MRYHIQGVFVLLIAAIGLLVAARFAAPVLSEALGDEGAIVAEGGEVEDDFDLTSDEVPTDAPLTSDEVGQIQADLTALGLDPGPADGIMGPSTRDAIDGAIAQYQLDPNSTDRAVHDYVRTLIEALAAATAADSAANDTGDADADG